MMIYEVKKYEFYLPAESLAGDAASTKIKEKNQETKNQGIGEQKSLGVWPVTLSLNPHTFDIQPWRG